MEISEKLKLIQILSGFAQEKLAKKLDVSFPTLNSWINEKSTPRERKQGRINKLYSEMTGQREEIEDVFEAKKKIIAGRSKKHDVFKEIIKNPDIYDQFSLSLTYHTNRIEGSTLTENETKAILFDNIALSKTHIIEQLEVKNHQAAWKYLLNHLNRIDEDLVLKLHGILLNSIRDDAGAYRNHAVRIVGAYVPTANHQKIPELMKRLVKDINRKDKDIIRQVADIHSRFEQIHPFSDGNGRVGRLLMQAMLLRVNLPPAIIEQDKKRFYNKYLKISQMEGDYLPLEEFLCDAILKGLRILERR